VRSDPGRFRHRFGHGRPFERCVSEELREPPDVDFEQERREEGIQDQQDLRLHALRLTYTGTRYRARGCTRGRQGAGRAEKRHGGLGYTRFGWSDEGVADTELKERNLNSTDRWLCMTLDLARELIGTPRHLSQHPGGFVLALDRLEELVPVEPAAMENRQVFEWDKDDIDALKFMKGRYAGARRVGLHAPGLRSSESIEERQSGSGHDPGRRSQDLRHDSEGRYSRRLSD
jgi:error-prone DNA polymerase